MVRTRTILIYAMAFPIAAKELVLLDNSESRTSAITRLHKLVGYRSRGLKHDIVVTVMGKSETALLVVALPSI